MGFAQLQGPAVPLEQSRFPLWASALSFKIMLIIYLFPKTVGKNELIHAEH